MAKGSLQPVSNDVIFVHTNTHMHENEHTDICSKRLPPSGFEIHLGGMWRITTLSQKRPVSG